MWLRENSAVTPVSEAKEQCLAKPLPPSTLPLPLRRSNFPKSITRAIVWLDVAVRRRSLNGFARPLEANRSFYPPIYSAQCVAVDITAKDNMGFDIDFKFAHKHAHEGFANAEISQSDLLGPLRGFVGEGLKRSWKGTGFNMLWRPNHGGASGPQDFFLELNQTEETLDFQDISGTGVANRGFNQDDIFMGALAYLQQVRDASGAQHFEPGIWTNVPPTNDPSVPSTLVRMGSIPHGTSINLQGLASKVDQVIFDQASITPFKAGSVDDGKTDVQHSPEEKNSQTNMPSRTSTSEVEGLDDARLADPNLYLADALKGLNVLGATVLRVTSESGSEIGKSSASSGWNVIGGGTNSTAFLVGSPTTNTQKRPNAEPSSVTATFWIERVEDATGAVFDQIQYSQRVLLDFNGLSWPHISVATLKVV